MTGKPSRYRWGILALAIAAYSISHLTRWSYSGIAKPLEESFALGKERIGLLGSVFFYPYALAQVPWGAATARFGGRITISLGVLLLAALLALFALVNAAVTERWGSASTGWVLGAINMGAQFAGAAALHGSGYLGIMLRKGEENPISEYLGIWGLGAAVCVLGAAAAFAYEGIARRGKARS